MVLCLKSKTGEKVWAYETMGEIVGAPNQATHPVSEQSLILVGSYDNYLHCVDAKKWTTRLEVRNHELHQWYTYDLER